MAKSFGELCKNINNTNNLSQDNKILSLPLYKAKIMGSYASYSSSGSYYAKDTNIGILKKNILLQNRFLHLDIYFNIQDGEKVPIVKGELNKKGILFKDCCQCIKDFAWSSTKLNDYPIFLFIYLRYNEINIDVSNKVANILIECFSDRWPDIKYKNGFQKKRQNLANEDLQNFLGKIVILTNYNKDDNQDDQDEQEKNKQRDNGYYLNELIHSYIKIYKSVNDIVHENNNINFAALKYHNDSNNKLSSNQYLSGCTTNKTNNYLSQLNNKENPKFLIALPDYKNRVDIPKTYTFDIMDNLLSRFNVLSMIYFDTDTKGQIFQLFINYIIFFTVNTKLSPIRELPNITSS